MFYRRDCLALMLLIEDTSAFSCAGSWSKSPKPIVTICNPAAVVGLSCSQNWHKPDGFPKKVKTSCLRFILYLHYYSKVWAHLDITCDIVAISIIVKSRFHRTQMHFHLNISSDNLYWWCRYYFPFWDKLHELSFKQNLVERVRCFCVSAHI